MQHSAATKDIMALCVKIVMLFSVFSTSFCCNSGWFAFEGFCYQVSQHLYDVQLAKRYCQLAGGQLAHINKSATLNFLNTIPNYNGMQEYWIDETSSITDSAASNNATAVVNCAYAKIQTIDREYCSEKKFFICQVKEELLDTVCPAGFDRYGNNCYRAITNKANYEDAKKFCILQHSRLAILDSEDTEWEAKSVIIGRNQTFMVDARKNDGILKWSNGQVLDKDFKRFYSDLNQTAPTSGGECAGILSQSDEPTVFNWVHLDCGEKSSFLCEADPMTTTTPGTTTTSTKPTPLFCPHGMNWKAHEASGFCYWETTYETDRLNWFQAREFCQSYGGDLASYENEEQENSGLGGARGHFRGLWIGMKRDKNDVFHWVDGTLLTYSNWDWNEPNLASKSKFCVTHTSGSSKWELDYCGVRRWFICKAPQVKELVYVSRYVDKKKQCDVKGVSTYRNHWFMYEDHCYLVQETRKYTWDTARLFCQDNDAHLASIHSFNETNFILTLMSIFPETNFWIGLSAQGLGSSYTWSDNTPLEFLYWSDNKTEGEGLNSCVSFNKKDGSWSIDHCNRLQYAVCKRGLNASYDFTTAEPTTIMPGNCENGWYAFGNKCYKYFGKHWSQRVQWSTAKEKCEELGASLTSVHSQAEQDLLTDLVLEANTDVWIGLHSRDGGTLFHWSDDSRIDYTNWNSNEPDFDNSDDDLFMTVRSNEACVEMEYGDKTVGKWNDIPCTKKKGYICEKMKDPTLTGPYEDPFTCSNISGWYRLGTSCYGFFEDNELTWLDAQRECRNYGADLITYSSSAVPIFVKRKLKLKDGYIWIGAHETKKDVYEFFAGSLLIADWIAGQPRAASTYLDNCVAMTTTGGWVVKSCKEKHPFICRFTTVTESEPTVDKTSSCDAVKGEWYDFGGDYCYSFYTHLRWSWGDAMHYCFRHGGFLASFHSAQEVNELQKHLTENAIPPSLSLHIGLGKKFDGSFAWVDSTPLDFINWDEGKPNNDDKRCVEMYVPTGKWNDIDCDETSRGFICSYRKRAIPVDIVDISQNDTLQKEILSHKLTAGGIFGIIVCILVILAVIGVAVYYLRPTKQVQPKLLEPELL